MPEILRPYRFCGMPSWGIDLKPSDLQPSFSTSEQSSSTFHLQPGPKCLTPRCSGRSVPLDGSSAEQPLTSMSGAHHCRRCRATPDTAVSNWTSMKPYTTHHTPHHTPPHDFKSGSPKVLKCCKCCMSYIIYYISGVDIHIYIYIYIYKIICLLLYVYIYYIIYIIYNIYII